MIDWNIQSRAHACQACRKPFADKQPFHTALFDQKQGYERLDVCEDCWRERHGLGPLESKEFISHWQSVYNTPPSAPPDAIQKDTAESLLRKLTEQNDPTHAAARYILAVMLERKRILKVKAQLSRDNHRIFVYEHGKTGDLFHIPDPNLQLDQLEEVQRDVAHLLEHGLNGGAAAPKTPSSAETGPTQTPAESQPAPPAAAT